MSGSNELEIEGYGENSLRVLILDHEIKVVHVRGQYDSKIKTTMNLSRTEAEELRDFLVEYL